MDVTVHFPGPYPFAQPLVSRRAASHTHAPLWRLVHLARSCVGMAWARQVLFTPGVLLHPSVSPTDGALEQCLVVKAIPSPDKFVSHLVAGILEVLANPTQGVLAAP